MTEGVDIQLVLRNGHCNYTAECPLLEYLIPDPRSYASLFPRRWDCGPNTFDYLLAFILEPNITDEDDRAAYSQRVKDGKWELVYRSAPIQRGDLTPEDRLWPA